MSQTWRDRARPLIAAIIADSAGLDEHAIRRRLRAAYPFGDRRCHPYKVWCDEVNVQLGAKARKAREKELALDRKAGQGQLFDSLEGPAKAALKD